MWAKYKFYVIGAAALVAGVLLYRKYGKKSAVEQEMNNPASKLATTGMNTIGDRVALMRAANFVN